MLQSIQSSSTLCNPGDSLQSARLLCPWDSPGKNNGVGCRALHQGIFLTQGSNQHLLYLLHWQGFFFFNTGTPGKPKYLNVSMLMLMFSQILVLSHFTGRVNKSRNLSPIIFITQVNLDFYTDKNIN